MLCTKLQVGFINFSSLYNDHNNPLRVDVNDPTEILFSVTTPHDILTNDRWINIELPLVCFTTCYCVLVSSVRDSTSIQCITGR